MDNCRLLLFDLDGALLRSDKTISQRTLKALRECRHKGILIRFSDGYWYKFTKKNATKENAIREISAVCGISIEEMTAFGDDYADIGMLRLCGRGIAMGNVIDEVKEKADLVIGSNDEDGIAEYLEGRNNINE